MYIINDDTPESVTHDAAFARGGMPRDWVESPEGVLSPPETIPLIPESEWQARIEEQEERQSSLEHLWNRSGLKCLNQNGFNYCWAHSTTHAVIMSRLVANLPYVPLSAVGLAATIKSGRNVGGWAALSAQFAREKGIPSQEFWPQNSLRLSHGTDECWADAGKHKITAEYVDVSKEAWGANLTWPQIVSCLIQNIPCALDFDWWGHSVLAGRVVWLDGEPAVRILNSWYIGQDQPWGENGWATLQGRRARSNGGVAVRMVTAA